MMENGDSENNHIKRMVFPNGDEQLMRVFWSKQTGIQFCTQLKEYDEPNSWKICKSTSAKAESPLSVDMKVDDDDATKNDASDADVPVTEALNGALRSSSSWSSAFRWRLESRWCSFVSFVVVVVDASFSRLFSSALALALYFQSNLEKENILLIASSITVDAENDENHRLMRLIEK